jgi:hypothetical protein
MNNSQPLDNGVAKYLKEITYVTNCSQEQIMINLKDCLKGKKCSLFSCGANIDEHKDKFIQIKNDKTFVTCCIKSAIEHLQFEADILALYGFVNGEYLKNDKINNMFILKTEEFEYKGASFNLDNFNMSDFSVKSYNIINFLNYVGVKEIYLFGFYLADYIINDLTNYNYYDDIVCKKFHLYDEPFSRTKEPGVIIEHCQSTRIAQYCIDNDISLYNVSELGCLSNKIKRINFESLFLNENEKMFIFSKIKYKDFLDEFDDNVDIDFYYERNFNDNETNVVIKKDNVFCHLTELGIYCLQKVNKYDTKKELVLNEFIKDIMCLISYIFYYPKSLINCSAFLCHYLLNFNKVFNVCFYNDFDKISCPNFYDDLLLLHINDINNINNDINFVEISKIFNLTKYNEHKYFKLFIYLFYLDKKRYKNIPDDFNATDYIDLNEDLKHMTNIEAKNHYANYGYKENRKYKYENIPDDFNVTDYINIYEDLKHMTNIEAKNHYEFDGYKENRKYKYENIPDDFNATDYINIYEDLKHMTNIEAKNHYEFDGYKENRKYKY